MAKKLVGLKKNDVVVLDPHKVAKGHDIQAVSSRHSRSNHDLKGEFKFGVEEIKSLEEHGNQELFNKITRKERLRT